MVVKASDPPGGDAAEASDRSDVAAHGDARRAPYGPPDDRDGGTEPAPELLHGRLHRLELVLGAAVLALGVVSRFVAASPLWLDEALTVNISSLPLDQIPSWLRHDGHPPLYYLLLHGWMDVFGSGDVAVRALSGVFGVALLPLVWIAGRRLGGRACAWCAVLILALSPYAAYYSTEARMYSLVMLLVVAGWLIGTDALRRPKAWRLVVLAVLAGLLLWSHYWGLWLLAAVGLGLVWRVWRAQRRADVATRNTTLKVLAALVVGSLTFLPWVPTLLYQSAHTGTPWAKPALPTAFITDSLADFGGGGHAEQVLLGWLLCIAALLGVFGWARDRRHVELDLRTRPRARVPAYLIVATLVVAFLASYAGNAAFATRYDAVWFPFFVLLVGLGLTRLLSRWVLRGALVVLLGLGVIGVSRVMVQPSRSESGVAAAAIAAHAAPGDVVVTCPDQLGPSLNRELAKRLPAGELVQGTFPAFASPKLVNWVDYDERVHAEPPGAFAEEVLAKAGDHTIFLAWSNSYITHQGICSALVQDLLRARPNGGTIIGDDGYYFEHEAIVEYPASPSAPKPKQLNS